MDGHEQTTDFRQLGAALRRRWWLVLAFVLIAGGAAYGISKQQPPKYDATSKLLFRTPNYGQDVFGSGTTPSTGGDSDPVRQAATNQALVELPVVAKKTSQALHGRVSASQISKEVTVGGNGQSDVVSITVSDEQPRRARLIANSYAREFIAYRAGSDRSKLLQALRSAENQYQRLSPADKAGPQGKALAGAGPQIAVLAALQTGNAELVQPAGLPSSAASPKPLKNTVIGALLGLLLGLGFALLLERMNRQIREPGQAGEAFELPVLGMIPQSKAISRANKTPGAVPLPFAETESFRTLRAALRHFNLDREVRSVVVTSGGVGEGKSTVAWNLALAAASSSNVIVIEADLRDPSLARQHELYSSPGLAEILQDEVRWSEAVQRVSGASSDEMPIGGGNRLDAIVAGAGANPGELLDSSRMGDLLASLHEYYDLVVVDTTPIGVVADAFPLLRKVDGVLVVTSATQTTRDSVERTRERLQRLDAQVLGIVVNFVKEKRRAAYGENGRRSKQPSASHSDSLT